MTIGRVREQSTINVLAKYNDVWFSSGHLTSDGVIKSKLCFPKVVWLLHYFLNVKMVPSTFLCHGLRYQNTISCYHARTPKISVQITLLLRALVFLLCMTVTS